MKTTGIVAFAFGTPSTIWSNKQIANIASRKAQELGIPIYTQRDVPVPIRGGVETIRIEEKFGKPPSTLRIARAAVQWAIECGFTTLLVMAAKPHLPRALRDIERTIQESGMVLKVCAFEEINRFSENSWFCIDSPQWQVRTREAWEIREKILNLLPFSIYKYIAK